MIQLNTVEVQRMEVIFFIAGFILGGNSVLLVIVKSLPSQNTMLLSLFGYKTFYNRPKNKLLPLILCPPFSIFLDCFSSAGSS